MIPLPEVLLFSLTGFLVGTLTGLVPGFHVNNAAVLVASVPVAGAGLLTSEGLAVVVVAAAVTHTFFDFVPSIFLGAPEPSTALSVLPGHRLLMEGRGEEALRLSALGSGGALVLALGLALPLKGLFGAVYSELVPQMALGLVVVSAIMVVSEEGESEAFEEPGLREASGARVRATGVFLLSGGLGWVALEGGSRGAVAPLLGEASVLFPLLTGLFGTSTLLLSLGSSASPPAQETGGRGVSARGATGSIVGGGLAGTVVGWLPGVTSAQAAVLAEQFTGGDSGRGYIVSVSAVNSANAVFTLVALYTIGRARSGAMAAFSDLVPVREAGSGMPGMFAAGLVAIAFAGLLSYVALVRGSRLLAEGFSGLDYTRVSVAVVAALTAGSLLATGFFGLQVLVVATAVGCLPPLLGVSRTHCMGCLLLPVILYLW